MSVDLFEKGALLGCRRVGCSDMVSRLMIDFLMAAVLESGQATAVQANSVATVQAVRVEKPPAIDGKLDDEAWVVAPVIDQFTVAVPREGEKPSQKTRVQIAYDKDNLYVAFVCDDTEPAKILARSRSRTGNVDEDDNVAVALAPFGDGRNGYYFSVSAAGAKGDGLIEDNRNVRRDWNTIWFAEARKTETGWVAEMAIPFKSMSVREGIDWGLNLQRTIKRNNEVVRWTAARAATPFADVKQAGALVGVTKIDRGLGLEFKPFGVSKFDFTSNDLDATGGFDLFWRATPTTTAVLTVNTDFAEAEVDSRRVNLTRFPLFFPERRSFFLQDAGVFNFGGIGNSPLPFYSRRIGLVNGEKKDILAGLKVTGREDDLSFGLMNVQMKDDRNLGAKNLSVARVSANVLDESTVGFIATAGDPDSRSQAGLLGADFNYRQAEGKRIIQSNSYLMTTASSDDAIDTDYAFGTGIDFPNDDWRAYANFKQVGEAFDPPLGFVSRRGVRSYDGGARYRWRFDDEIARVEFENSASLVTDLSNNTQSASYQFVNLEIENRAGDEVETGLTANWENLEEDFDIRPDITIPTGEYDFLRGWVGFSSSGNRVLSAYAYVHAGQFYDGTREDYETGLTLRLGDQFNCGADFEFNDVHLPGGDFLVRIIRARTTWFITPDLDWRNSIQYDSVSDQVGLNSRIRWEVSPGQEAFFVLNQGWSYTDNRFESTTSALTVKVGLTVRF
jgi:hypothetical protein